MRASFIVLVTALSVWVGCTGCASSPATGQDAAATSPDAGRGSTDAGVNDAGPRPSDAGAPDGGNADTGLIGDAGADSGVTADSGASADGGRDAGTMTLVLPDTGGTGYPLWLQISWIHLDGGYLGAYAAVGQGGVVAEWFNDAFEPQWTNNLTPPNQLITGRPSLLQFGDNVTFIASGSFGDDSTYGCALGEMSLEQALNPDAAVPTYADWVPGLDGFYVSAPVSFGNAILLAWYDGYVPEQIQTLYDDGGVLSPLVPISEFSTALAGGARGGLRFDVPGGAELDPGRGRRPALDGTGGRGGDGAVARLECLFGECADVGGFQ
jgi:hypothetical protein